MTTLHLHPYLEQNATWPSSGRHILAQFDADSIVVYQAYNESIGHFAARTGHFGGDFSFNRMSWIKPNFLWMMYRSGWAEKYNQTCILAIRIPRSLREEILSLDLHSQTLRIRKSLESRRHRQRRAFAVGPRSLATRRQTRPPRRSTRLAP